MMTSKYFILGFVSKASLAALVASAGLASASAQPRVLGRPVAGLPAANPVEVSDTVISTGFSLDLQQQGLDLLENPAGSILLFGYLDDGVTRTEPDENTYLVLDHNPGGPTEGYDYGRHFLFQGHENSGDLAFITRINLDVSNPNHRVTLLTPPGEDGLTHFNSIDGSCWDPFTQTMLFAQERGTTGGVIEIAADFDGSTNSGLRTHYGSMGRGGYEGIHPDDQGNLLIIEDVGGALFGFAKNPNSFVYRFVPTTPTDLTQGKLQALQVSIDGEPVVFHPEGDTLSENQLKLLTVGARYPVQWVTVHDTAIGGDESFDANAAAKAAGATPFKRPENGQFLPAAASAPSTSTSPATPTRTPATTRPWPPAAPGAASSESRSTTAVKPVRSDSSSWATPRTRALITSPLPAPAHCWPRKTGATPCTTSSICWIRSGPTT